MSDNPTVTVTVTGVQYDGAGNRYIYNLAGENGSFTWYDVSPTRFVPGQVYEVTVTAKPPS